MSKLLKALLWASIPLAAFGVIVLARWKRLDRIMTLVTFSPAAVAFLMGIILITVGKMGDFRKALFWTSIPFDILLSIVGPISLVVFLGYSLLFTVSYIMGIAVVPTGMITAIVFLFKGKKKLAAGIFLGTGINLLFVGLTFYIHWILGSLR